MTATHDNEISPRSARPDRDAQLQKLLTSVPIDALDTIVSPDHIDANGHMGSASYFILFQNALAAMFRPLGFGTAYRERGFSTFQRETHVAYESELRLGDPIFVQSWLVAHDRKRFQHFHEMRKGHAGTLVATADFMTLNVSLDTRRSAAFPDDIQARLDMLAVAYSNVPTPPGIGKRVAMRRP